MRLREFAPAGGGGSGDYFQALASAWYNGVFDTGSLQKGIKSQEDVERLLNRGIVCPDGKTRKLHIDYNSDFDGVEIYSDDYYEYGDHDDTIDSRTGQKWGPYDFMAFSDDQLDEATGDQKFDTMMGQIQREPKYPDSQMPPTDVKDLYQWAVKNNKPYHKIFATWANREGYKSVAPALQRAGNLDTEALDYWTPRVWKIYWGELNGIDSEMPPEWAKKRVPDELRDYLDTVFDAYDRIVFDWPTEYRQIGGQGNYVEGSEELDEACWKGYHKEGMKTMFGKRYPNCVKNKKKTNEEGRIARKAGQPANSKKHSDLYTDENPRGTITGLKFATVEDAKASVSKIRSSGRSHAHKVQAAVAMEQRARAAGKASAAAIYRTYINSVKKTDESLEIYVDQGVCPVCHGNMVAESQLDEKQDACYHKVKSRYKVWPSAYASGALVQCRKKGAANWGNANESITQEEYDQLDENLKKWFSDKWVRFGPDGKIRGDCARGDSSEGKPKCLPQSKAYALGKKGRASAAARKRRQDPNAERSGPAKNVATKEAANPAQQAAIAINMKKHYKKPKSVVEDSLNEFAPGEGGFGPFKVYISNEFIEKFPNFDQAKEEIEFLQTADPKSFDADWKIIDGTGKIVWQHDPGEAIDAMRMRRKIQFIKPDEQGVIEAKKKKKKKSSRATGGYFFPGYGYYGSGESGEGGGDGGGGESKNRGMAEGQSCAMTEEGAMCPVHGLEECGTAMVYEAVGGIELAEILLKGFEEKYPDLVTQIDRKELENTVMDAVELVGDIDSMSDVDMMIDDIAMEFDSEAVPNPEPTQEPIKEHKLYYNVIGTPANQLRSDFGLRKDNRGWYLNEDVSIKRLMTAFRAFGEPTRL